MLSDVLPGRVERVVGLLAHYEDRVTRVYYVAEKRDDSCCSVAVEYNAIFVGVSVNCVPAWGKRVRLAVWRVNVGRIIER